MTRRCRSLPAALLGLLGLAIAGCPPPAVRVPLDPIPMQDAAGIVNENVAGISYTLRASGTADGYFTTARGRRRSYHVDATLFYLAPTYFRFDLKKFGERQILLGSNDEWYWYYSRDSHEYLCGRHGVSQDLPPDMPVRPGQIVDALGLTMIPTRDAARRLVQRVVDDYQQLLVLTRDDRGRLTVEREYWLDRCAPRLVRRIVFRDSDGVVEMESKVDDYRPLAPDGPWLPHSIVADWPKSNAGLRFRVARWAVVEQVKPDSIQFATPRECDAQ